MENVIKPPTNRLGVFTNLNKPASYHVSIILVLSPVCFFYAPIILGHAAVSWSQSLALDSIAVTSGCSAWASSYGHVQYLDTPRETLL